MSLLEATLSPEDFEAAVALLALGVSSDGAGWDASRLAPEDRRTGPGSSYLMAPFLRRPVSPSRFSDGTFGVLYAAERERTAIAETRFHQGAFLSAVDAPEQVLEMRVLRLTVSGTFPDIRGLDAAALLQPDDYSAGQAFGMRLATSGAPGLVYPSVREPGGACVAVFRPRVLSSCDVARTLHYKWDGRAIAEVYEVTRIPDR